MAATTGQPTTTNRQSWLQAVVRFREAGIIIIILLLSVLVTLRSPAFLTLDNLRDILLTISILVIVALGQTMVIITRGIDLSVGSMIGLTAMIVSFFVVNFPDTHPAIAVVMGMAIGTVLGGINGVVISYAGVPPIIATLGTLSIYRGLVFWYSEGNWVNAFEMPQSFRDLAKGTPLGVPNLIIFAVVVAIAIYLFLNYTRMGRNIYAVGSNPDAAKFAGIPMQRVIFTVYLLSGLLCGLAGVLWASRFEAAQTNTALGFELQTVAAPVVGGVNIFGGSGSVVSVLLGAFLLGIINNALTLVRISPFWQLAAQGLLILASVVADAAIIRRLQALTGRSRT
jgi:rhamnose transport system permease protein